MSKMRRTIASQSMLTAAPLESTPPRHTTEVLFSTLAVCITAFANSSSPFRMLFFGVFVSAIFFVVFFPFLRKSQAQRRRFIVTSAFAFAVWNLLAIVIHPLDERSFYNGLIAIACVSLLVGFTRLGPDRRYLVAFVHQLGWVARALLLVGIAFQFTASPLGWSSKTGVLWLLLFFVFIDPKISTWSKFAFLTIWYVQAYGIDDRAYLFVPVLVFVTYLLWPFFIRVKVLGAIFLGGLFVALALFPVAYIQLSVSEHRQALDELALQFSGGRFFSGRDVIWSDMLAQAAEHGLAFGGGHAISPTSLFTHDVSAHNTFISVLARTGIIGLVLFSVVFAAIFVTYASGFGDPVVRWSAAFTVGILFKQSTEMSLLGNNVAIASLSWLVISFGLVHLNSRIRGAEQDPTIVPVGLREKGMSSHVRRHPHLPRH